MASKKRPALRRDENEIAFASVMAAIGEGPRPEPPSSREKNPEAVSRGRKGGKAGGKARKDALTPKQRQAIARKAAHARWNRS
jgi:hypothetical protein